MTDSFVTQCPHCQTRFRVNTAQLSVARGVVRCGSCLQVFNAARQLLEQHAGMAAPEPQAAPPAEPSPPAPRAISQKQWNAEELDLDGLDEEMAKLERQEKTRQSQPISAERRQSEGDRRHKEEALSASRTAIAEQAKWAASLFSDPSDERAQPVETAEDDNPPPLPPDQPPRSEPTISFDADADASQQAPLDLAPPADNRDEPQAQPASPVDAAAQDPEQPPPRRKRPRPDPEANENLLQDLEDDPLHLYAHKRPSSWGRRLFWGLMVVLAAATLGGQYIAYQFDDLARQDQYRPWFQALCPKLGCTVPSRVDIAHIKSSNLVVRSHPEFSGALVVDAIIYNRATFSQPFPLLELRFADMNGHMIASRRFKPSEYLSGELAGVAEMPSQTPIHIALDILDPGNTAVNYSLSFHSPE